MTASCALPTKSLCNPLPTGRRPDMTMLDFCQNSLVTELLIGRKSETGGAGRLCWDLKAGSRGVLVANLPGGHIYAGASSKQVESVWRAEGWDQKLKASIENAGPSFSGRLTNPDEPWHYDYMLPPAPTESNLRLSFFAAFNHAVTKLVNRFFCAVVFCGLERGARPNNGGGHYPLSALAG